MTCRKGITYMKNIIALSMALIILFGFAACARKTSEGSASPDSMPGASAVIPSTPAPTSAPTPSGSERPEPEITAAPTGERSPEAIWEAIFEEYGDTFPATESVTEERLKELTGIDPEKLESFVFQFPMMNVSASEFLIAECKEGQLEAVREEVEAHQAALAEQWKQYLPEQMELVENYVLETADNYLFFAVAENAEGAAGIFKGYF